MNMNRSYLKPMFDCHKSFYGKAEVVTEGNKKILYSYKTPVATICKGDDGEKKIEVRNVSMVFSRTTVRHIVEFFRQNGIRVSGKADLEKYLVEV